MITPTQDDLIAFAKWAEQLQPNAVTIMRQNGYSFTDLEEPWQKLSFSLYSDLCEINNRVKNLFEEDES